MSDINVSMKLAYSGTALTSSNASDVKIYVGGVGYDASYADSLWTAAIDEDVLALLAERIEIHAEGLLGGVPFDSEGLTINTPAANVAYEASVGFAAPTFGIENPRFIDFPEPKPFPVAENVPEAAGEAPTAAEFKALLDALIAAGLMEAAAEE